MTDPKYSFNYFNRTMRVEETTEKYVSFSPNKMLMLSKLIIHYTVLVQLNH